MGIGPVQAGEQEPAPEHPARHALRDAAHHLLVAGDGRGARHRGLARLRRAAKALEGLVDEFVGEAPAERLPADE
jgi:hypothetical protein